jgi:hypothetical protein
MSLRRRGHVRPNPAAARWSAPRETDWPRSCANVCSGDRHEPRIPHTQSQAAANTAGSAPVHTGSVAEVCSVTSRNHDRHTAGLFLADHGSADRPNMDKRLVGCLGCRGVVAALPALADRGDRRWPRASRSPSGRCHSRGSDARETVRSSADECHSTPAAVDRCIPLDQ